MRLAIANTTLAIADKSRATGDWLLPIAGAGWPLPGPEE